MHAPTIIALLLLFAAFPAHAQGTKADYERAANLRAQAQGKLLKGWIDAQWLPGEDRFWYRNELADGGGEFVFVDAATGTRRVLFTHGQLLLALGKHLDRKVDVEDFPVTAISLGDDAVVELDAGGKSWRFESASGGLEERAEPLPKPHQALKPEGGHRSHYPRPRDLSPDGKWRVKAVDRALVVESTDGGEAIRLTEGESIERPRIYWAPDSSRFVFMQRIPGEEHIVHAVESSPQDRVQPKLKSWRYTKPGDRIAQSFPRLFEIDPGREVPLKRELFGDPWSNDHLRWEPDSSRFTFLYNQRGHQVMRVLAVDARTGELSPLIQELPETFFNYFQKLYLQVLEERGEILWMSERDGWNHLYRFDLKSGALINQVTKGEWLVRGVDRIDPQKQRIWFRACGMNPGEDPYHVHFYRINFDGTGLVRLTEADGTHNIRYSPDRRYFVDNYSRIDLPPRHELRRGEDGGLVCKLEEADISQLEAIPGWNMPERFVAKGRDGKTDIWGVIHRPDNFDPGKTYPVIEKIYAGPHGQYVPKKFYPFLTAMDQVELGFIVVVIDGMGTNWRSKAFHDVCWQNLKDAGFPDRIAWLKTAAEKYPSMDLSRVGIYGGSAGGQNALGGLLFHPEFYKVAVADCGCHDNRMDKIHWNEAWMGLMGPHYAENSNVTHAHTLEGKLLLTVGELDTNVDPASTMQVVDALIKADKDFDLVIVPGAGHGVGETPYLRRRRQDFFVRHLMGREPRQD